MRSHHTSRIQGFNKKTGHLPVTTCQKRWPAGISLLRKKSFFFVSVDPCGRSRPPRLPRPEPSDNPHATLSPNKRKTLKNAILLFPMGGEAWVTPGQC